MTEDWTEANRLLDEFRNDVQSLVDKDFQAAECATKYQPTIYNYTDVKGALGILQSGHLWFTERIHLNDPVEIRYGLDTAHQLFEAAANKMGGGIPTDALSHLTAEHGFGLSYYGFWIACFSLDGNDLGQWRSYADDGRGICLGFSTDNFDMTGLAVLLPNAPNSLRFPINYQKDILCRRLQPYINRGLDIYRTTKVAERESYHKAYGPAVLYERDLFLVLNNGFYANALQSKHPAYANEKEYRLLVSGVRDGISRCAYHRVRERKGEIVGFLDLPIPNWKASGVLTHIRLGPASSDELRGQLQIALASLGIPVPTIDKSDIPFRAVR